jgi:hypothetical protein
MRLGKEEAVGYVEDTIEEAADDTLAQVITSGPQPLTPAPEPVLPVG